MQMGHDEGGNPNIHTWACPGGHIATNRGTGIFVPLSSFTESKSGQVIRCRPRYDRLALPHISIQ